MGLFVNGVESFKMAELMCMMKGVKYASLSVQTTLFNELTNFFMQSGVPWAMTMSANPATTGTPTPKMCIKRPLSRPVLVTTSCNIEGLTVNKEILLSDMCKRNKCDILVLQETHRGTDSRRPKIEGMKLVIERPHEKYGSVIFARPNIDICSRSMTSENDTEILTVELQSCTVTSVYKPPKVPFNFSEPDNFRAKSTNIVIGDFNCHNTAWGYSDTNEDGDKLESWADHQSLRLIHEPKLPASFNSGRWKRGYNPDNIFVSEKIAQYTTKQVENPIPRSQHRPITCAITAAVKPHTTPFKRRFNFKKARWNLFTEDLEKEITEIKPEVQSYDNFVDLVHEISRRHIPRGCRIEYISGLNQTSEEILKQYEDLFQKDPFSDETVQKGEELMALISETRREKWCNLLQETNMTHNSRKAWKLVKSLSNDPSSPQPNYDNVTADQIAHQLLLNGKTGRKIRNCKIEREPGKEENSLSTPLSIQELQDAIKEMKNNKAAGLDDIRTEQIKHFGPGVQAWVLELMNTCIKNMQIPKMWRKARVVALLKPGKDPNEAKNFRPVSLLCHLFKVMERMVFKRVSGTIDKFLIKEQAGFRPGRSCTGQVLNLTQYIEDGYQRGQVTGVAFLDLSAAYDTVNHKLLTQKVYKLTKDYGLAMFVKCILQNRRFCVSLQNQTSRWRTQKNGLAQGSVLAPLLFNIYTNDQPINPRTRTFIYADDSAVAAQGKTFETVEAMLTSALEDLAKYYEENGLKPNPTKSQVCAFHLRNRQARRKLQVTWQGQELEHCETPKYLGVKLDRSLTFKQHCHDTKKKVQARNNILRKLTGSSWGAQPHVLRTTGLALSISASEYAAPVWRGSAHAKQVDIAVNEAVRIVVGCLKPTPTEKIYPIAGIAPPSIRRTVAAEVEKTKQSNDPRHPLHEHQKQLARLKSRKSFIDSTIEITTTPGARRLELWREMVPQPIIELREEGSAGFQLPFLTWKSLNRLRTGVTRCKLTLAKWGYCEDDKCECGLVQDLEHLLVCPEMPSTCCKEDLFQANDKAISVAEYWKCI